MSNTQNLIADLYYERTRIWNNDDVLRDVRTKCIQAADDLARLMAENERHEELFERIDQWAEAYPTDLWPEVHKADWPSIDKALTAAGWSLSRISASNMRHVIARIKELADKVRVIKGEPK